ncbi:Inorganic pyrophosphatase [Variovorax sp. PBS-H4]|uniref:inorganic diphosphatase n=1 Tax=Variovorax sp. PBS-H4 TaxID=434008 RepID=UPI0013179D06|nr:inorganic diphosphatase [Variovorax sp. PBS-H4]VTU39413.1 Inorganic pyrophosphatase [Variovorax sp. PBS-H4]
MSAMPTPPPLHRLALRDPDGAFRVVIEANQGSRNKLKYDTEHAMMELHLVLPLGVSFPYDFGFLPSTLGADGDPLDALVLMDESVPPGTVVPCRLVGVIEAEQTKKGKTERNDRFLLVATSSHRFRHCKDLPDVATDVLDEVEHFFEFYNKQKGVEFRPVGRHGRRKAEALLKAGEREAE